LKTDRIDLLQLHNIRMEQIGDDALWNTIAQLQRSGKIRYSGIALGPAIGWLYEGVNCIKEREVTSVQHIYNMLEQHPGRAMHEAAAEAEGHHVPDPRHAFVGHARGQIHSRHGLPARRSPESPSRAAGS
jgi:aryl-alcohol dehydrogenase-like predicted oxidoreductase